MTDTVIKCEGVYKKFTRNLKRSMFYGTCDMFRNLVGRKLKTDTLRKGEFWVLENLNFEVKRGETLGLIGKNGSGKSTLLRLLTGIFPPDRGMITIRGRVGALIAVGAGFHPHMTGRENLFLNGTILGMTKTDISKRFDEIVEFSEIGEFLDAPVATYSSGMRVRLGFAIAVHMEPDILLIDEVLAVGDEGFRKKSLNKIHSVMERSAVIFVSHSMPLVARTVSQLMILNNGENIYHCDDVEKGISIYYNMFKPEEKIVFGSRNVNLRSINIFDGTIDNGQAPVLTHNQDFYIELDFDVHKKIKRFVVNIIFLNNDLNQVAMTSSAKSNMLLENSGNPMHLKVKLPNYFSPGAYNIVVNFAEPVFENRLATKVIASYQNMRNFQVIGSDIIGSTPIQLQGNWS